MKNWLEQLQPIVIEFKDGSEKLSLEDVIRLTQIIQAKINLAEGNICEKTYKAILDSSKTTEAYELQCMVENARHYLCDGDLSVKKQVEIILKLEEDSDDILLSDIPGVLVWEAVVGQMWSIREFLDAIGYQPEYDSDTLGNLF